MKKDSYGNDLPEPIFLANESSMEKITDAMVMNSFLIAVGIAMKAGHSVLYNADTKSATISNHAGIDSIVRH